MTQREGVLAKLLAHPEGVPSIAFLRPRSGKPILRAASRIAELRAAGYVIESKRLPNGTALYRLISSPEPPAPPAPPPEPAGAAVSAPRLFDDCDPATGSPHDVRSDS